MSMETRIMSSEDDRSRSPLRFHSLTFLDDGDDVVVGRPDIERYAVIPADGAALLRRLSAGARLDEAALWYDRTFGEPVDIEGFVESMRGLDFIREDVEDTSPAPADPSSDLSPASEPVRWQRLGAAVFSQTAGVFYLLVLVGAVAVVALHPELAPRHQHVFFTSSLLVCELTIFLLQFPLVLLHELAHVLAGRRLGLRTRVRVSRRLYFVVFETVMNGLVSVPRARRYLPMLAGMLTDILVAAACTLTAWWLRGHLDPTSWVPGLFLALAFTTLLRTAWQLYFFLRTDIYYLITTVLGCVDLHSVSRLYLANAVYRLLGHTDRIVADADWHPRDRQAARWYAPLVVAGYATAIGLAVLVMIPLAWTFLSTAVRRALLGQASSSAEFWDSAILLVINGAQLVVAGVLFLRERRVAARDRLVPVLDGAVAPPVTSSRRPPASTPSSQESA
jgi:hypothetical protein